MEKVAFGMDHERMKILIGSRGSHWRSRDQTRDMRSLGELSHLVGSELRAVVNRGDKPKAGLHRKWYKESPRDWLRTCKAVSQNALPYSICKLAGLGKRCLF